MLELSANSDFNDITLKIESKYYDLDGSFEKTEIYGAEALDQGIESVLCTEPFERLFNLEFSSPMYRLLFENFSNLQSILDIVHEKIEQFVPIKIYRNDTVVEKDEFNHSLSIKFHYVSNDGTINTHFSRVLSI